MKNFKFLILATAVLAVGSLASSCVRSDDPVVSSEVTKVNGAKYSIIANSNLNATFSVDVDGVDAQANVKSASFNDLTAKTVKVTAKYTGSDAADYVNATQTVSVKFSNKTTTAALNFTFVKKSTTTVGQDDAKANGATLTNDDKSVAAASMVLPVGIEVTNGVQGAFGLTAYKAPVNLSEDEDLTLNQSFSVKVVSLNCQPDGAAFNKNVSLVVDYGKKLAGKTVTLKNGTDEVSATVGNDGKAEFGVAHFSDWEDDFAAFITGKEVTTETIATVDVKAVAGTNEFTYKKYVGVEHDLDGILAVYVNSLLGYFGVELKGQVDETASFEATGAGDAKVTVSQDKTVYTFDYNGIKFQAARWGSVAYKVEINGETTNGGHSGGAGK